LIETLFKNLTITTMKKIIAAVFIMFMCAASYSQIVNHSTTISVPGKDSSIVTLDCTNSSNIVFFTPDDSTTVRTDIDTSYKTTVIIKWTDGSNAIATLLASGTYEVNDPVIKKIKFINMNTAAILIEIKYRCGY